MFNKSKRSYKLLKVNANDKQTKDISDYFEYSRNKYSEMKPIGTVKLDLSSILMDNPDVGKYVMDESRMTNNTGIGSLSCEQKDKPSKYPLAKRNVHFLSKFFRNQN